MDRFELNKYLTRIVGDIENIKNTLTEIKIQRDTQFEPFNELASKLSELNVHQKSKWFEYDRISTYYYSFGNSEINDSTYLFRDYIIVVSSYKFSTHQVVAIIKPNIKYRHRDKYDNFSFIKIPNVVGYKEIYFAIKNDEKHWCIQSFEPNFPYMELFEELQLFIENEYQKKLYDLTKDVAYSQLTYTFERE